MPRFKHYRFDAAGVIDGKLDTCWQPAGKDSGFSWLRFTLAKSGAVGGLTIHNGFQRKDALGDLFRLNSRLDDAWVIFDDGQAERIKLKPNKRGAQTVTFRQSHETAHVTLVVREAEPGDKWQHLGISEVAVLRGAPVKTAKAPAPCGSKEAAPRQLALVRYCELAARATADIDVEACSLALVDAFLLCRVDGHPVKPIKRDVAATDATIGYNDIDVELEFEMEFSRKPGGAWRVTDLVTGNNGEEN
ncbi:MAG: hypothetical protein ACI9MR_000253 [Myxococcota bacterium]|jgi:hypothetical protein